MAKDVRERMVSGAMQLLATSGVQRTSIQNVTGTTRTPRGSIYHFFPRGKDQLIEEALERSCKGLLGRMDTSGLSDVPAVVRAFCDVWRHVLTATNYEAGCAVVGVAVSGETPHQVELARDVFDTWQVELIEMLSVAGMARESADEFAQMLIASCEGAVVLCRTHLSLEPLDVVERQLIAMARLYANVGGLD